MSSNVEVASGEALTPGQQLIQQFQDVWDTEKRAQALPPLAAVSGLEAAINQYGVTAATVETLSSEQLATIGAKGLTAYFHSTSRHQEKTEANNSREEALLALNNWIHDHHGRAITVTALDPEDRPIHLVHDDGSYGMHSVKKLATVTGKLSCLRDPYNSSVLVVNRKSIGRLHLPGYYLVNMYVKDKQPRVEVTVE